MIIGEIMAITEKGMEIGRTRILVKTKTIKLMIGSKEAIEEDSMTTKRGHQKEGLVTKALTSRIERIIHTTNLVKMRTRGVIHLTK